MTAFTCQPDTWTTIPWTTGDLLLEARGKALYVDIGESLAIANKADGYALHQLTTVSIPEATATTATIRVAPAGNKAARIFAHAASGVG